MAYSGTAFRLPMGIYINSQKPIDLKYGPYHSIGIAIGQCFNEGSPIGVEGVRHLGLTIGITHPDGINPNFTEYWFRNGVTNNDLILKASTSSSVQQEYYSGKITYTFVADVEGDGEYEIINFPKMGDDADEISIFVTAISIATNTIVSTRLRNITVETFEIGCSTNAIIHFRVEKNTN